MNRLLFAALAVSSLSLAACGGGGSGSSPITPPPTTPPAQGVPTATQSISIRIPLGIASSKTPASHGRRPQYVSPDTSKLTLIIDGNVLSFSVTPRTPSAPGGSPSSGSQPIPGGNGETISYSSTAVTDANGAGYYQVNAGFDMFPGNHTIGLVLQSADGFVLSEDQRTYRLTGGSNPDAVMYLRGVADSAFLCNWPNCDGTWGSPDANGNYTVMAFVSDHTGDAIAQQKDANNQVIPLANGPFSLVETDNNNVVTIGNAGPFTEPGADTIMHNGYSSTVPNGWPGGHQFTIHCNTLGSTKVAVQLASTSPPHGVVTGFDYTALIDPSKDPVIPNDPTNSNPFPTPQTKVWTTPGQYIGTVPTQQYFGNQISVNCDAHLNLTVQ